MSIRAESSWVPAIFMALATLLMLPATAAENTDVARIGVRGGSAEIVTPQRSYSFDPAIHAQSQAIAPAKPQTPPTAPVPHPRRAPHPAPMPRPPSPSQPAGARPGRPATSAYLDWQTVLKR